MKPVRIQRKRTKGWRIPQNTVCVSRGSEYGNPWRIVFDPANKWRVLDPEWAFPYPKQRYPSSKRVAVRYAVYRFREWLRNPFIKRKLDIERLRGKNLACWCPLNQPCHADVLLEIANA